MSLLDLTRRYSVLLRGVFAQPRVRFVALTIYYLGILIGLFVLYGSADYSTPPFIYQNF